MYFCDLVPLLLSPSKYFMASDSYFQGNKDAVLIYTSKHDKPYKLEFISLIKYNKEYKNFCFASVFLNAFLVTLILKFNIL